MRLGEKAVVKEVPRFAAVYHEGASADALFLLLRGSVVLRAGVDVRAPAGRVAALVLGGPVSRRDVLAGRDLLRHRRPAGPERQRLGLLVPHHHSALLLLEALLAAGVHGEALVVVGDAPEHARLLAHHFLRLPLHLVAKKKIQIPEKRCGTFEQLP